MRSCTAYPRFHPFHHPRSPFFVASSTIFVASLCPNELPTSTMLSSGRSTHGPLLAAETQCRSISHLASTTRCSPSHPSMFGEPLGPPHNLKHRMIITSLMEMKIYFGRKKTPAASHIVVDFSEEFGASRRITG